MDHEQDNNVKKLKTSKKGINILFRIVLGWYYFLTNKNNELARKRISVCVDCEYRKWFACKLCGCPLQMKGRDPDGECPHPKGDKWKGL